MPEYILAIDPGNEYTAYAMIDAADYKPFDFAKLPNKEFRDILQVRCTWDCIKAVVIEQVAHYGTGMPAGATVFDTCYESGRFAQIVSMYGGMDTLRVPRTKVKTQLCGTPRAKDSNVIQALKDRFGDKGTKKNPGWFYGFKADCWQAYALGVAWLDMEKEK